MSKLATELNGLPVDTVDVLPASTLEALETGHGMTELAASSSNGDGGSCTRMADDDQA
jgi:hypothetical protein